MYFTCSSLKTTMTVKSCADYRSRPPRSAHAVQACVGCTKWEDETTNPENLQTAEQFHAEAIKSIEQPVPVRFDRLAEHIRIRDNYRR